MRRPLHTTVLVSLAFATLPACGPSEARQASFRTELVKRGKAVEERAPARPPVARDVLPGSFGEAFDAATKEREAIEADAELAGTCATKLAAPGPATSEPKQTCLASLRPTEAALTMLLDLRRAERPGTPPSVHPFAPMTAKPGVHRSFTALCSRARAEVYADLARSEAGAASVICTHLLQTARDYGLGANLTGAMVVASCVERLEEPCTRAIDALPAEARGVTRTELAAVASTLPVFADVFDTEVAGVHLGLCGGLLGPGDIAQLGPRARAAVASGEREHAAMGLADRRRLTTLCIEGFEDLDLQAKAYRAAPGSPERSRFVAERAQHKATIPGASYDKYEEKIVATESRIRSLASH